MGRSPCCDKSKVKRGTWSPEEDATLKNYLLKHGTKGNWIALPQKAGLKRCGKSCRLRWLNYLRPDIKHGAFTQEEENIICSLYNKIGSRWSAIASHLTGRTDNDVKNYWNTKLKKKLVAANCNPPTTITATAATTATIVEKTTTFQASTNPLPLPPPFSEPFLPDNAINFNFPRFMLEGQISNFTGAPFSQLLQDSSPSEKTFMDDNNGVDGVTAVDEYSYDVLSGMWSQEEAIGADSNADLFSIFQVGSKPQGLSQSHYRERERKRARELISSSDVVHETN